MRAEEEREVKMRGGKTGEVKGRKGGGDVRIRRLQDLFGRDAGGGRKSQQRRERTHNGIGLVLCSKGCIALYN